MMKILLTNDDGIYADGLWAVYRALDVNHDLTVIAPDRERSAVGHGITLHDPLRATRVQVNGASGFAVNGTPADCVKLGVQELFEGRPDLVISGINLGENVGINLNYSGTVSAAREAALFGLTAMAVSIRGRSGVHLSEAACFVKQISRTVMDKGLPFGTCLNVNIPDLPSADIKGVKVCKQAVAPVYGNFEKREDPRRRTYYWQKTDAQRFEENPDLDGCALSGDYISITPVKSDITDHDFINHLRSWSLDGNGGEPC